jgi:Rrf2 family protein
MSTSSRFAVAIHALTFLAASSDETQTSEAIATSVNTNPVVIRRLLGDLRVAKLVDSQAGARGGWRLVRTADAITLRDVYRAVEDAALFGSHTNPPNARCAVGGHIVRALSKRFEAAHQALEAELSEATIADVLKDVRVRR